MSVPLDDRNQGPTRPLLRAEYDALVDLGHLVGEPIELIDGQLVWMSPEGSSHARTIMRIGRALTLAIGERAWVRTGAPFAASEVSEPEPDVAVVPDGDYYREHPSTALLLIEVSFSSIQKDRMVKQRIYAAAGVPEYWIVDLTSNTVIVMREPRADGYGTAESYERGQAIALLAFPEISLALEDFLPPAQ